MAIRELTNSQRDRLFQAHRLIADVAMEIGSCPDLYDVTDALNYVLGETDEEEEDEG